MNNTSSKKEKYIKATAVLLAVMVFFWYIGHNLSYIAASRVSVEQTQLTTVKNVVTTTAFVVRDEVHLDNQGNNSMLLTCLNNGVYLPLVNDSSKVAVNDTVALNFPKSADAQTYSLMQQLDEQIDSYTSLQQQSILSSFDVSSLNSHIKTYVDSYVSQIESANMSDFNSCVHELESGLLARQTATGETSSDFTAIIDELSAQRAKLAQAAVTAEKLQVSHAGYYIRNVDGYEQSASYSSVDTLSAAEIDSLISSPPASVPDKVFGKVIGSYIWYAVCTVPDSVLRFVKTGSRVVATFGESGNVTVNMKVYSLSENVDGRVALVLECGEMNETIADLRIEKAELTIKTYEGYKVVSSALRQNEEGVIGVYILYGNYIKFRTADILYYDDSFVVVSPYTETSDSNALRQYDNVIVKGRNLYDGKDVYQ